MTAQRHVALEHYLLLARGKMVSGEMLQRMHRHVLEGCEACRAAWDELVEGQRLDLVELLAGHDEPIPFDPTPPAERPVLTPSPYESAFSSAARRINQAAKRLTQEKQRARRELQALLAIPAAERERTIVHSRKRFRSPALAHLLVEEARTRVRRSWQEALELLDLAHHVVMWIPGAWGTDWARELTHRAEALRANAYRIAGQLGEAERRFRTLRQQLATNPVLAPSLEAEVASLEASLRADQGRTDEALALLDQAVLIYQEVGEREGLARALIKRASVAQELERHELALGDLERARGLLDRVEQGFLYLFTVAGAAPILLDLERYEEAEQVLIDAQDAFEAAEEPWWALRLRGLLGRAALGLGALDRAERLLDDARQGFVDQGLPQDTANAALYLALVYLHQGRTADVRRLCREIVPIFRALGVDRHALATLGLFQKATAADAAALAHLAELRRHLRTTKATSAPLAGAAD